MLRYLFEQSGKQKIEAPLETQMVSTPQFPRSQLATSLSKGEWHYHFSSTSHINHRWVPMSPPRGLSVSQSCPQTSFTARGFRQQPSEEWAPGEAGGAGSALPRPPGQLLVSLPPACASQATPLRGNEGALGA